MYVCVQDRQNSNKPTEKTCNSGLNCFFTRIDMNDIVKIKTYKIINRRVYIYIYNT